MENLTRKVAMQVPTDGIVAYESRVPGRIFVPIPDERNRWLITDRCVALRACPQCGSAKGVPCLGAFNQFRGGTHYARRHRLGNAQPGESAPDITDGARWWPDEDDDLAGG